MRGVRAVPAIGKPLGKEDGKTLIVRNSKLLSKYPKRNREQDGGVSYSNPARAGQYRLDRVGGSIGPTSFKL